MWLWKSPENEEGLQIASSILQDATAAVQATNMKRKRSNDDLTATQVSLSFISGEKVSSKRLKKIRDQQKALKYCFQTPHQNSQERHVLLASLKKANAFRRCSSRAL